MLLFKEQINNIRLAPDMCVLSIEIINGNYMKLCVSESIEHIGNSILTLILDGIIYQAIFNFPPKKICK